MKRTMTFLLLFGLCLVLAGWGIATPCFGQGPLTVDPANPRYFMDNTGKAIYLAGSETWYNIHYNSSNLPMGDEDFEAYLDWLQEHGHNFTRLWTGWANNFPKLWIRTGPGTATDGDLKFDLAQLDQNYFDLIRKRVLQITNRGMYCSVMFFGSAIGFFSSTASWERMTWHPYNNINNVQFSTTDGTTFFTAIDEPSVELQKMLIRKFIDTLNDQDNIIWEIANEGGSKSRDWQSRMAEYVRSYEATMAKQHLIGITGGYNFGTALLSSAADWISPDWDAYEQGGPANYVGKIIINDTDHLPLWGSVESAELQAVEQWVWKAFTRGTHPVFCDPYNSNGLNIDPAYDQIRYRIGDTALYAGKMNLAAMVPSSNANDCSTTYCLRNPGKEYLIYQPTSDSSFRVNLPTGTYYCEWFNATSGNVEQTRTITVRAGRKSFMAPFNGDAVLYLKKIR